jgi:hypothetical protein
MNVRKFPWTLGFALLIGMWPGGAEADLAMTSISACGPAATVQQVTQPIPPVTSLNSSCSSPHFGSADVTVDPANGSIGGTLATPLTRNPDGSIFDLGNLSAFGVLSGTFSFIGMGTVTAQLVVSGTMTFPSVDSFDDAATSFVAATLSLGPMIPAGSEFFYTNNSLDTPQYTLEPANVTIPIDFATPLVAVSVSGTPASPDELTLNTELNFGGDGGATLDLSDPAQLVLELGPGVTVTSNIGFATPGPGSAVPEPSSLTLLLGGAAGALAARLRAPGRRRRLSVSEAAVPKRARHWT